MAKKETFNQMLSGGHHNSLGRTEEVMAIVLKDRKRLKDLYNCYFDEDELVRLRTSNAIKKICMQHPAWLVPYIDRLLTDIAAIDQASTQWTLSILFKLLAEYMSPGQVSAAKKHMKKNLVHHNDWIVLNFTMETLSEWAIQYKDTRLKKWLLNELERIKGDTRKSVAKRAQKYLALLQ